MKVYVSKPDTHRFRRPYKFTLWDFLRRALNKALNNLRTVALGLRAAPPGAEQCGSEHQSGPPRSMLNSLAWLWTAGSTRLTTSSE